MRLGTVDDVRIAAGRADEGGAPLFADAGDEQQGEGGDEQAKQADHCVDRWVFRPQEGGRGWSGAQVGVLG